MTNPDRPMLTLRPYQTGAIDSTFDAWFNRGLHSVAGVLPTGAGKTPVLAGVADRWTSMPGHERDRVLVLAHRTELIEQAADKIRSVAPRLSVGIVKAERNETLAQIVVGSVQTLASEPRRRMLRGVGLVMVDECHHAAAVSYRSVMAHYGVGQSGGARALGVTATLSRGDGKALGDVWQDVVFEQSIADMVRDGWLIRPRGIRVWVDDLDLSRVRQSRGDYSEGDLGRAIEESQTPAAVAKALTEHAPSDPTIVFAPTVASAEAIRLAIAEAGFTTALVHGAMPVDDRRRALADFRARRVQVLCNCMVLTEGTDLPLATCCVIARPTKHHGLYIQMAGRVLRPNPGKTYAIILDVVGATQKHSLQAHVELFGDELDDVNPKAAKAEPVEDELSEVETLDDVLAGDGLKESHYGGIGTLLSEEVDLFHSSASSWMRTVGGLWFLPTGERYIVVHPSVSGPAGTWDVSSVKLHRGSDSARYVAEAIPDLSYARAWGEDDMSKAERKIIRKTAEWRLRVPDKRLRDAADQWGVRREQGMTAGELNGAIMVAMASARLDPFMAGV
jgi:superfamily II DNA or RNA helicase